MIILFSPAKTFRNTTAVYDDRPLFLDKANHLVKALRALSLDVIQKKMNVSEKVAQETHQYYQAFGADLSPAIYTYYGQAFKSLDVDTLLDAVIKRFNHRVYIMSGLYGLVRPLDAISKYRLEMKDKTITDLYLYWKSLINTELGAYPLIINLASHEYDKIIDSTLPVVTLAFLTKKDQLFKSLSMEVKTMRGAYLRHIMINDLSSIDEIKQISINGYQYDADCSDPKKLVFIKKV